MKKIFKGPLVYLILAPIIVLLGWSLITGAGVLQVTSRRAR